VKRVLEEKKILNNNERQDSAAVEYYTSGVAADFAKTLFVLTGETSIVRKFEL
jgi:hypothetical protein